MVRLQKLIVQGQINGDKISAELLLQKVAHHLSFRFGAFGIINPCNNGKQAHQRPKYIFTHASRFKIRLKKNLLAGQGTKNPFFALVLNPNTVLSIEKWCLNAEDF
jgi:hypothetical protein